MIRKRPRAEAGVPATASQALATDEEHEHGRND
jgi:hypothetical protein